ncbi:MAG: hypothetical protein WCO98_12060 [bacterium]
MKIGFTKLEIIIVTTVLVVLGVILFPVFTHPRCTLSASTYCLGNQKQMALCVLFYAQDHEEVFPDSSKVWSDINVDKDFLTCRADRKLKNGYLYNNNLSGRSTDDFDSKQMKTTIITVDGVTKTEANRTLNNIYYTPSDVRFRHGGYAIASYLDGHAESVLKITEPASFDKLIPIKKPALAKKTGVKK